MVFTIDFVTKICYNDINHDRRSVPCQISGPGGYAPPLMGGVRANGQRTAAKRRYSHRLLSQRDVGGIARTPEKYYTDAKFHNHFYGRKKL